MIRNIAIHANFKCVLARFVYTVHVYFIYQVGALVLKKDFRRKKRKGGKLDDRWLGPYTVAKDLGKGFYSLGDGKNLADIKRINGAHLKIYEVSHETEYDSKDSEEENQGSYNEDWVRILNTCTILL